MIVKVQVPLASNLPVEEQVALIYDKDRTFEMFLSIDDKLREHMGDEVKKFFEVEVDGNIVCFLKELEDQRW